MRESGVVVQARLGRPAIDRTSLGQGHFHGGLTKTCLTSEPIAQLVDFVSPCGCLQLDQDSVSLRDVRGRLQCNLVLKVSRALT